MRFDPLLLGAEIFIREQLPEYLARHTPGGAEGFTGLEPRAVRGISEIRTILGALLVGLGASVLDLYTPGPTIVLVFVCLAMALVRELSILVDPSPVSFNIISFVVELISGVILVI